MLREQRWEERLGEPVTVEFRGRTYLRQRDDGACMFWQDDGRCRIHAEFGLAAKPIACQLFPFSAAPMADGVLVGVNFACQSVQENKGASLRAHRDEIKRMFASIPEVGRGRMPLLDATHRAEAVEVAALTNAIDGWLARRDLPIGVRLDGLAWLAHALASARLDAVRGERFVELVTTLVSALPEELELVPVAPVGARSWRMLRQAAFARIEDLRIADALRRGRLRSVFGQLLRSRRFASGHGVMPHQLLGWPSIELSHVMNVGPSSEGPDGVDAPADSDHEAIDDLLTRWLRMTILGGRAWGAGHYGWPMTLGLSAVLLNLLVVLWLARAHASGSGRATLTILDVRAALGRVDRHAGRAPWLGGAGEKVRISYLQGVDAWRGLLSALTP